jgi:hypothetical protein
MKNKTAGGKVLRNKTRSAAQQEVLQTTAAKIHEHQRELHEQLQTNGLAKYSEEGDGTSGKEGKSWKRFQSYKGEAALPKETESLRVSHFRLLVAGGMVLTARIDIRRPQGANRHLAYTWVRCTVPHQYDQECQQERGG